VFLIPIISAVLYLAGGQWNKWFRWGMGLPIGAIACVMLHSWVPLLCGITYFIATNAFSYGEKMIWTKLFGGWFSIILAGVAFGLAATPILGWTWGIAQAIIGGVGFGLLKWLDDTDRLKNPFQELCRGFIGTIMLAFA